MSQLYQVKVSLIKYNKFFNCYLLIGLDILLAILFIGILTYRHHEHLKSYTTYHPFRLANAITWLAEIPKAFVYSLTITVLCGCCFSLPVLFSPHVMTGAKPLKRVDQAIVIKKHVLPKHQHELRDIQKQYRNEKYHTSVEKKTEPTYVKYRKDQIKNDKIIIRNAKKLRVPQYYLYMITSYVNIKG